MTFTINKVLKEKIPVVNEAAITLTCVNKICNFSVSVESMTPNFVVDIYSANLLPERQSILGAYGNDYIVVISIFYIVT